MALDETPNADAVFDDLEAVLGEHADLSAAETVELMPRLSRVLARLATVAELTGGREHSGLDQPLVVHLERRLPGEFLPARGHLRRLAVVCLDLIDHLMNDAQDTCRPPPAIRTAERTCFRTEKESEINEQHTTQVQQPPGPVEQPRPWSTPGVWTLTTTAGFVASGYLPQWAEDDPSEAGVPQEELGTRLAGISHRGCFDGVIMMLSRESRGPEPEEDAVFEGSIDCTPYADEPEPRVPVVNVQVCPGTWILGLDPKGLADVVGKLRSQADLLDRDVLPRLVAAREDWVAHQPV